MTKQRRVLVATFAFAITFAIVLVLLKLGSGPIKKSNSVLKCNEATYHFGSIEPGQIVRHSFILENGGSEPIFIDNITASCGCTLVASGKKSLQQGDTTHVDVIMNTAGKSEGPIIRSIAVTSNSRKAPNLQLLLEGSIVMPERKHTVAPMNVAQIFKGSCANCHALRGQGELGLYLFRSDCAMCHHSGGDALPPEALSVRSPTRESLTKTITLGKDRSNMPAFGKSFGGPLDSEQIATLADYIIRLKSN